MLFQNKHCNPLSLDELKSIISPEEPGYWSNRKPGTVWQPVDHYDMSCMAIDAIESEGYRVTDSQWYPCLEKDSGLIGTIIVKKPSFVPQNDHPFYAKSWDSMTAIHVDPFDIFESLYFYMRHSNNGRWAFSMLPVGVLSAKTPIMMESFIDDGKRKKHCSDGIEGIQEFLHHLMQEMKDPIFTLTMNTHMFKSWRITKEKGFSYIMGLHFRAGLPWRVLSNVAEIWDVLQKEGTGLQWWSAVMSIMWARSAPMQIDTMIKTLSYLWTHTEFSSHCKQMNKEIQLYGTNDNNNMWANYLSDLVVED